MCYGKCLGVVGFLLVMSLTACMSKKEEPAVAIPKTSAVKRTKVDPEKLAAEGMQKAADARRKTELEEMESRPIPWQKFTDPDGHFRVKMPGTPQAKVKETPTRKGVAIESPIPGMPPADGVAIKTIYSVETPHIKILLCSVFVHRPPHGFDHGLDDQERLKDAQETRDRYREIANGTVRGEKQFKVRNYNCLECEIVGSEAVYHLRVMVAQEIKYVLILMGRDSLTMTDARIFLDSFEFLDK